MVPRLHVLKQLESYRTDDSTQDSFKQEFTEHPRAAARSIASNHASKTSESKLN